VASINIVPQQHRGKLSGLYNTAENFGRFVGPVSYSTAFAFSISRAADSYPWMDHGFVFYLSAVAMFLLAGLGWHTLTSNVLVPPTADEETQ